MRDRKGSKPLNKRWGSFVAGATNFLLWILISLLAIAFIREHPYLGLAIALAGGVIVGLASSTAFESKP